MKKQVSKQLKQSKLKKQKAIKYRSINFHPSQYSEPKDLDEFYIDIYQQFKDKYTKGKFSFASTQEIKKLAQQDRCFFTQAPTKSLIKLIYGIGFYRINSNNCNINGRIQILDKYQYLVGCKVKLNLFVRAVRLRDKIETYSSKNIYLIHFYNCNYVEKGLNNPNNKIKEDVKIELQSQNQLKQENQNDFYPFDNKNSEKYQFSSPNLFKSILQNQSYNLLQEINYQSVKVEQDESNVRYLDKGQEAKIIEEQKAQIALLKKENESLINEKYQCVKHILDLEIQIRQLLNENSDLGNKLRTIEINILKEMQRYQQKEATVKQREELKKKMIIIDDN